MVTAELLHKLGYSSIEEYFEAMLQTEIEGDGQLVLDLMLGAMSEEQKTQYEQFSTTYYYEYHDNK